MLSSRFAPSSASVSPLDLPAWIERCCLPLHLLNLDAPLIAALWQHSFAQWAAITLSTADELVLPLVVWSIYTLDRLLDVSATGFHPTTARHQFTKQHAAPLTLLVAIVLPVTAIVAFGWLQQSVLYDGTILFVLVLSYFGLVHRKQKRWPIRIPKEVLTGLLFGAGTALTSVSHVNSFLFILLPVLPFTLLCTLNCFAIEIWESQCLANHEPVRSTFAQSIVVHLQPILLLTCAFATLLLVCFGFHSCTCSLLCSSLAFLWVRRHIVHCQNGNLIRLLPDLPLLSPLLFLSLR